MAKYTVKHDSLHNSYVIYHKRKPIASVESELKRPAGFFRKAVYHWHVQNIPGAPRTPFVSDKSAIDHAIKLHKMQQSGGWHDHHNPVTRAGQLIDELGDVIWHSSKDPRYANEDMQSKMQDLSILHANLVRTYRKHFGK